MVSASLYCNWCIDLLFITLQREENRNCKPATERRKNNVVYQKSKLKISEKEAGSVLLLTSNF